MHSISTPIAGLEGGPEGGALNEGQADLWAYTITDAEAIRRIFSSRSQNSATVSLSGTRS